MINNEELISKIKSYNKKVGIYEIDLTIGNGALENKIFLIGFKT